MIMHRGRAGRYGESNIRDLLEDLPTISNGVIESKGDPCCEAERQNDERSEKSLAESPRHSYILAGTSELARELSCKPSSRCGFSTSGTTAGLLSRRNRPVGGISPSAALVLCVE